MLLKRSSTLHPRPNGFGCFSFLNGYIVASDFQFAINKNKGRKLDQRQLHIRVSPIKQPRAQKTLDEILQAAKAIIDSGVNPSNFTARNLANCSGFALGTIINRVQRVENAYLIVVREYRKTLEQDLLNVTLSFAPNQTSEDLVAQLIDCYLLNKKATNMDLMRFFESRVIKNAKSINPVIGRFEFLAPFLANLSQNNTSGTFRLLNKEESKFICRAMYVLLEQPFINDSLFAGSKSHRDMASAGLLALMRARGD